MSRSRVRTLGLLSATLLLAVVLLAPTAAGASAVVVKEDPAYGSYQEVARGDDSVTFAWRLLNINSTRTYFVQVEAPNPEVTLRVEPNATFFLGPGVERQVLVTIPLPASFDGERSFQIDIHARASDGSGEVETFTQTVRVFSHNPLVLGLFANPLPPPLDNEYGAFLLNLAFWVAFGAIGVLFGDAIIHRITRKAARGTTQTIVSKLRTPVFLLIFLWGIASSLSILPPNAFVAFLSRLLRALVTIFGAYVAYRVLDAALFYYTREIAPRTATQIDDILVPAARKVGAVIIFIAGFLIMLKQLNVDLTVFVGGAAVASLVIAFAAQDTLSNFFSGVFLIVDRPFVEGDDIQIETGEVCRVERIGLRSTRLLHYRNYEVIVLPNNQLSSKRIINLNSPDPRYRISFDVGVAYGTDTDRVRDLILKVMESHPDVVKDPLFGMNCWFSGFGESSLNFSAGCFVNNFRERHRVLHEVRTAVNQAFLREGIEVPFPQRTLWIKEVPGSGGSGPLAPAPPTGPSGPEGR